MFCATCSISESDAVVILWNEQPPTAAKKDVMKLFMAIEISTLLQLRVVNTS